MIIFRKSEERKTVFAPAVAPYSANAVGRVWERRQHSPSLWIWCIWGALGHCLLMKECSPEREPRRRWKQGVSCKGSCGEIRGRVHTGLSWVWFHLGGDGEGLKGHIQVGRAACTTLSNAVAVTLSWCSTESEAVPESAVFLAYREWHSG